MGTPIINAQVQKACSLLYLFLQGKFGGKTPDPVPHASPAPCASPAPSAPPVPAPEAAQHQ